jgi:hypothetical protein
MKRFSGGWSIKGDGRNVDFPNAFEDLLALILTARL